MLVLILLVLIGIKVLHSAMDLVFLGFLRSKLETLRLKTAQDSKKSLNSLIRGERFGKIYDFVCHNFC